MLLESIRSIIRSLGSTYVEVYEWDEATVRKARLPSPPNFRKLTRRHSDLIFSGWNLAHAVVKADYLDRRNLAMPGVGFLLQVESLLELGKSPLELRAGATKALNDVSLTSLSGRVGQGLAILYGQSLGLGFAAHLRSHVHNLPESDPAAAHKDEAMADFLFANKHQTVLIESKGSFTLSDNDPSAIKRKLKDALTKQIDPWMGYLQPVPTNGYVIYSCLRETSASPSALFVVDPDGEGGVATDVPFTPEQVLRENYAAWLRAMGLPDAAARLVSPAPEADVGALDEVRFLIRAFEGRRYAFHADQFDWPRFWARGTPAIGIDLEVLRAISTAIQLPTTGLAESLQSFPLGAEGRQRKTSIFPDGSLFGPVDGAPLDIKYLPL